MYVKAVIRDRDGYCSAVDSDVRYEVGRITVARCIYSRSHDAPVADCECGIYSVPLTLRGLARLSRYLPPELWVSLIAVEPIGRAYTDGTVVRSERVRPPVLDLAEDEDPLRAEHPAIRADE